MQSKRLAVLAAIMLLAVGAVFFEQAERAEGRGHVSRTDVFTFRNPDGTLIPPEEREVRGHAELVRSADGVTLEIETTELGEGVAYTVWWVVFNNPEECDDDGCNATDLFTPAVEASVLYATGRVTSTSEGTFRAFLPVGLNRLNRTVDGRERQRLGPGLQNPWTAEIHFIIRCHGEASDNIGMMLEQISTINGGCPGGVGCFDPQAGAFPLPGGGDDDDDG